MKSAVLLETQREPSSRHDKGYIGLWFGELLEAETEHDAAATMYRAAWLMWHDTSPPRADEALARLNAIVAVDPKLKSYLVESDWRVEAAYSAWLADQ